MTKLRYLLALLTVAFVIGAIATPPASAVDFSSTNPYCIGFMNQIDSTGTPAEDCYASLASLGTQEDYYLNQRGGHLLAIIYEDDNYSGGLVDLIAPDPNGGCGQYTYRVDHMFHGWNDRVSSMEIVGPYCNVGRWFADASRSGTELTEAYYYGVCSVPSLGKYYFNDRISSFTLGRWDANPSGCTR